MALENSFQNLLHSTPLPLRQLQDLHLSGSKLPFLKEIPSPNGIELVPHQSLDKDIDPLLRIFLTNAATPTKQRSTKNIRHA